MIGCSAPSERRLFRLRAYDLSPSKRTRHPVSKIDRHRDLTPSPSAEEQRILMRAPSCGVEELVARLGAEGLSDPTPGASVDEHAPSRAFFSTYGSADLRSNVFLMILVSPHRRRHGRATRKAACRSAP